MHNNFIEPASDHVLVIDCVRDTTIDGISLPDNVKQQEMLFGMVIFVGPACTSTKVQDKVCYGPYAGKHVVLDGVEFRLLTEGQIEAYIRDKVSE
jgi:co-chaperonin GroES (HSP10)